MLIFFNWKKINQHLILFSFNNCQYFSYKKTYCVVTVLKHLKVSDQISETLSKKQRSSRRPRYFNECNFDQLVKDYFKEMTNLKQLNLAENNLKLWHNDLFEETGKENLDLSYNAVVTVKSRLLRNPKNLSILRLNENGMRIFRIRVFYRFHKSWMIVFKKQWNNDFKQWHF